MRKLFRVVDTDNFGSDYPDEKFITIALPEELCKEIALWRNSKPGADKHPRYWKVVPQGYKLQPGFEP